MDKLRGYKSEVGIRGTDAERVLLVELVSLWSDREEREDAGTIDGWAFYSCKLVGCKGLE